MQHREWEVKELIRLINEKLQENRSLLHQSLGWGRLTWRQEKSGKIEVYLEPKL